MSSLLGFLGVEEVDAEDEEELEVDNELGSRVKRLLRTELDPMKSHWLQSYWGVEF